MDIGIVGHGVVGRAVVAAFQDQATLHVYDPAYPADETIFEASLEAVWQKSAFIFICVPTPQQLESGALGGPFDARIIDPCMETLGQQPQDPEKTVVIGSTTLPSKICEYKEKYSHLRMVVCPEFLVERTALNDFLNPKFRILGGESEDTHAVQELFEKYSCCAPCPVGYCDAPGAALIKYMGNAFLALKVSILNQFYELWEKSGSTTEWIELAKLWHLDTRIGNSHYEVPGFDGDRGWGGKCFPKDVNALLHEAHSQGVQLSLLEEAWNYNKSIRANINWVAPPKFP